MNIIMGWVTITILPIFAIWAYKQVLKLVPEIEKDYNETHKEE